MFFLKIGENTYDFFKNTKENRKRYEKTDSTYFLKMPKKRAILCPTPIGQNLNYVFECLGLSGWGDDGWKDDGINLGVCAVLSRTSCGIIRNK